MRIIGHGIDIVEIEEIAKLEALPGSHFLSRCFTDRELVDVGDGIKKCERLAGRFAAKEATAKAMGVGAGDGFAWSDIEITTAPSGAPGILLHRGALEIANSLGITGWLVSTSHADRYAVGSAIAFADDTSPLR